jgi:cytidylate kinase
MNHMEIVKKSLADKHDMDIAETGYPFLTISRQAGAGGHTLAREIIRQLDRYATEEWACGWEVFDYKLCLLIVQNTKLQDSFESLMGEEYRSGLHQAIYEMLVGKSEQYTLQKQIFEIIRILASIGRVVIVGRGGAFVTHDMPAGVHIRLVASEATRVNNMMSVLDVPREKALRTMQKQDRDRARMIRDFFNRDISDPMAYHATWDMDKISTEDLGYLVVDMLASKAKLRHPGLHQTFSSLPPVQSR